MLGAVGAFWIRLRAMIPPPDRCTTGAQRTCGFCYEDLWRRGKAFGGEGGIRTRSAQGLRRRFTGQPVGSDWLESADWGTAWGTRRSSSPEGHAYHTASTQRNVDAHKARDGSCRLARASVDRVEERLPRWMVKCPLAMAISFAYCRSASRRSARTYRRPLQRSLPSLFCRRSSSPGSRCRVQPA